MLNLLKKKQNNINYTFLYTNGKNKKENNIQNKLLSNEYKNLIYYPSSNKEWFTSIYSYNKSYQKQLIAGDTFVNNLFLNYINMFQIKIKALFKKERDNVFQKKKVFFKRRWSNKKRYSAEKIYLSKTELKHTNSNILIILYVYNKKKLIMKQYLKKIVMFTRIYKVLTENDFGFSVSIGKEMLCVLKKKAFISKKKRMKMVN